MIFYPKMSVLFGHPIFNYNIVRNRLEFPSVLWDVEKCTVPTSTAPLKVAHLIYDMAASVSNITYQGKDGLMGWSCQSDLNDNLVTTESDSER